MENEKSKIFTFRNALRVAFVGLSVYTFHELHQHPKMENIPYSAPVVDIGTMDKETSNVINKMQSHPELFKKEHINDAQIYYPFYKAVQNKFNVPWYLLYIIHEDESSASRDPRAFDGSTGFVGAMQRNPRVWNSSYVDTAAAGLEYLKNLPQRRHAGHEDYREIAFAGRFLKEQGVNEGKIYKALHSYCVEKHAIRRFYLYNRYKAVFG